MVADVENSLKSGKCPEIRLNSDSFFFPLSLSSLGTFFRNKVNDTQSPFERPPMLLPSNIESVFVFNGCWRCFGTAFFFSSFSSVVPFFLSSVFFLAWLRNCMERSTHIVLFLVFGYSSIRVWCLCLWIYNVKQCYSAVHSVPL